MKKKLIISTIVAVAVVLGAGGTYAAQAHQAKSTASSGAVPTTQEADAVFREYLIKSARTNSAVSTQQYRNSATSESIQTGTSSFDISHKQVASIANISCSADLAGSNIKLSASVQTQGTYQYIRLNSISSDTTALSDIYAAAKGTWYKLPDEDTAMQSQLESGALVFTTAIFAPSYDADKIATTLLHNRAFEYSLNEKVGDSYVYSLFANRTHYLETLQMLFPDMTNPQDVIQSVFGNADSIQSTVTVSKDGDWIKDETMPNDLCVTLVPAYAGSDAQPNMNNLSGTSTPAKKGSATIAPVTKSKPATEMGKDLLPGTAGSI